MALERSTNLNLECCAVMDHSDLCHSVYRHNFARDDASRLVQKPIERLTVAQVDAWKANVWMMSPPCQPHTRQHDQQEKELDDPRSRSFLHLCELLPQLACPPDLIVLENVVGFEESSSCERWMVSLAKANYATAQFHLQPTQVGLPNDRPRYYCVAARNGYQDNNSWLSNYLTIGGEDVPRIIHAALEELQVMDSTNEQLTLPKLNSYLDENPSKDLLVPDKVRHSSSSWCFDLVTRDSRRSSCFTSGYGKFVRGTGSIIVEDTGGAPLPELQCPEKREFDADWQSQLPPTSRLRYFSGGELARLLDFHRSFEFPPSITQKQQWKLLGNSLNVRVASRILKLGLLAVYGTESVTDNPS